LADGEEMLNSNLVYRYASISVKIFWNLLTTQAPLWIRWLCWKYRILRGKSPSDLLFAVSLTSYPQRYKYLKKTLQTLISQSVRPNIIIVNLFEPDFALLNKSLKRLSKYGVVYRSCKNDYKSYLKLAPLIGHSDFDAVITVDDDIYYPRNFVLELLSQFREDSSLIVGHRGFLADLSNESVHSWKPVLKDTKSDSEIFLTGVGGILYPAQVLKVFNDHMEDILRLAPSADDLGFFFVENELRLSRMAIFTDCSRPKYWPGSQTLALWKKNVRGGENSKALRLLKERFHSF
jgi:hypothetical protein